MKNTVEGILDKLKSLGDEKNRQGMARYGIDIERAFGIKVTTLRQLAKDIGSDHRVSLGLWESGYHEARMLATIIADPKQLTEAQVEAWVRDLNSWDLCDGFCGNLVDKTSFAYQKAIEWVQREPEFERRAGLALMAWLPVHDKKADDAVFEQFFPYIEKVADDERNYVKKAVSWALRNIGKRSLSLRDVAVEVAERIGQRESRAAQWVANDVMKELNSKKIVERLEAKAKR